VHKLEDTFGRRFAYLRLSLTDACNFKCGYCLPQGYQKDPAADSALGLPEVLRLVRAFAALGMRKIRLTGGEPTLRRDLLQICEAIKGVSGVEHLALSTNGYRLRELAPELRLAGVDSINVSVDSLDPDRFREITGGWGLAPILEGIERCLAQGFRSIKLNAVLLKTASELELFLEYIRSRPISVRFIELMPTQANRELFERSHVRSDFVARRLVDEGWRQQPRGATDGPAFEFAHSRYVGRIGVIAPYSDHFCQNCNRLRVTSQGALRLCLFSEGNASLRDLLQHDGQLQELQARVVALLQRKEISHYLPEGRTGDNRTFSAMGG
jgi:cyclic pyranopterin phosphate synthase